MTAARNEQPLVSVVTPVYNGAEFIRECIESVLAQTYENWEYVVVDNCSTDSTLEIAREYEARDPRIRVLTPAMFVDPIESGNRSLREISPQSKYTKVLHADDWLFPECLERMVALAERNPTVGIVSAYRLEETRVTLTGLPHSISVLLGARDLPRAPARWLAVRVPLRFAVVDPRPHRSGSCPGSLLRSGRSLDRGTRIHRGPGGVLPAPPRE